MSRRKIILVRITTHFRSAANKVTKVTPRRNPERIKRLKSQKKFTDVQMTCRYRYADNNKMISENEVDINAASTTQHPPASYQLFAKNRSITQLNPVVHSPNPKAPLPMSSLPPSARAC
jgi:hypothetical protein